MSFTRLFCSYFYAREDKIMPETKKKLEALKAENESLRAYQKKLEEELQKVLDSDQIDRYYSHMNKCNNSSGQLAFLLGCKVSIFSKEICNPNV